jgi:hypothetical protein
LNDTVPFERSRGNAWLNDTDPFDSGRESNFLPFGWMNRLSDDLVDAMDWFRGVII